MSRSSSSSGNGSMNFKRRSRSHSMEESSSRGSFSGGEVSLKKGPWTATEDKILKEYVRKHGGGNWNAVQKRTGLRRCGKSCRLRWTNHLRPNLKKCPFSHDEERLIAELHAKWGNKWAKIASYLPGRTDNEIKNYWNTRSKRCQRAGLPIYPSDIVVSQPMVKEESQLPKQENQDFSLDSMYGNFQPNAEPISCAPPFSHLTGSLLNQGGGYQINSLFDQLGNSDPSISFCDGNFNYSVPGQDQLSPSELFHQQYFRQLTHNLDSGDGTRGFTPMVNYSASQAPLVTEKVELPSLQLHESRFGQASTPEDVDFYDDSLPMAEASECALSRTNGLLDDMIRRANARTTGNFNVNASFVEVVSLNSPVSTLTGSASSFNESSAGKNSMECNAGSITPGIMEEAQNDGGGGNGLPQSGENVDVDLSNGGLDYVNGIVQFESWNFDGI